MRFRLMPQLIAFTYYHVSWLLYVLKPGLSYRLNADFEDHAEHEYMRFVAEHPELERRRSVRVRRGLRRLRSVADLFRQIAARRAAPQGRKPR